MSNTTETASRTLRRPGARPPASPFRVPEALSRFGAAVLCLLLAGCCTSLWKGVFQKPVENGSAVVESVQKTDSVKYAAAVENLFDVVSSINTGCAPKKIKPKTPNASPLQLDFNLLHEFMGPDDRVQVTTVPAVSPGQWESANGIAGLYGISESDNYKFAFAPNQNAFVYVFRIAATGDVTWMYPRAVETATGEQTINPSAGATGANPTPGGRVTELPAREGDWLYLDPSGRSGLENYFVVVSKARQIGLEMALAQTVAAAREEMTQNLALGGPPETVVHLPLIVPQSHSGLAGGRSGDATTNGEEREIQTQSGPVAYTPRTFKAEGETILLARSVLHLPPRNP